MRRWPWAVGAAVLATAAGVVVATSSETTAKPTTEHAPPATARVEQGKLAATVSLTGTLTYRARSDGEPYQAINQASGVYTSLPREGDEVRCGEVLYRVDDEPVLLLCGWIPAYRDLAIGDEGRDVRQLNRNLHVDGDEFTWRTEDELEHLQDRKGLEATGELAKDAAVFLPRPVRIAKVTGKLGGAAKPGAVVAQATAGTLEVQVNLDASQQGEVHAGDRALITLPGNRAVRGRVARLGSVARTTDEDGEVATATIPAYLRLTKPVRGLDQAPVRVEITTRGVERALSVPVTALVGKAGGGFAVEVVRGRRTLVPVELGLFDTTSGRVAVEGELDAGDRVVVPSP